MSLQAALTALLLPPLVFALLALLAGLLAWRGRRGFGLLAAGAALAQLALSTPLVSGALRATLEHPAPPPTGPAPQAIIVLGAEVARGTEGPGIGPLTLERLRAGARLHRATGLPILVTAGPLRAGEMPLALLMAQSLAEDFATPPRWLEPRARDTRENALFSAALLGEHDIRAAYVVTHAWHMPRAFAAFARTPLAVRPAPVRIDRAPEDSLTLLLPSPTRLVESWYFLREWAGRLVYALRDG